MDPEDRPAPKSLAGILAVAGLLFVVVLVLGKALGVGVSPAMIVGYLLLALAGYAVFAVGMPFLFWIVGEAGYRTLLKPYLRAWHIRRIRNKRLWDEAAARDNRGSA